MNRIFLTATLLLCLLGNAAAQENEPTRYDTQAEILATPAKTAGEYSAYDTHLPPPTKPPKGYKPVYISHFGRHGSRYALSETIYEQLRGIFAKAHADGKLTYRGERLYQDYEAFYPKVAHREGELTLKGQEQHRQIVRKMIKDYPNVFKGKTHAEVISTNVHRVILSMTAFLNEIDWRVRDFDFAVDAGNVYYPILEPSKQLSPSYIKPKPYPEKTKAMLEAFTKEKRNTQAFAAKFFSDTDYLEKNYGMALFQSQMWVVISDLPNLDFDPGYVFADVFTPKELYNYWETRNLADYIRFGNSPFTDNLNCMHSCVTVKDILEKAEEDLSGNRKTDLRLRFSHDTGLMPLLSFMGVNSFGARIDNPDEVASYWRCFDIPMGANLQLVFFRSQKNPEILVKALLNGREAVLPFESVTGPFYSWNEFKAYYEKRIQEAEAFLARY